MKLQVNQSKLLSNIGTVFTDKTKVISELVQNARRAGATSVAINYEASADVVSKISISDNGSGISDFTKLFILAESGWDADVQVSEQPYGMGFFSTLSCAKTVTIRSLNQFITLDSEQALAGADIGEPQACDYLAGTEIILEGVDILKTTLQNFFMAAFHYSSIEILVNGVAALRALSLPNTDQNKVVDTPFGKLVMNEWFIDAATVIVQEMRVGSFNSLSNWTDPNILFANNRIQARMPDRDAILDKAVVEAEFTTWLKSFYHEKLTAIRAEFANDIAFLEQYFKAVLHYCPTMLNEIDWLPACAFTGAGYPILCSSTNYESDTGVTSDVKREALESGQVFITSGHADLHSNELVMSHFLYRVNAMSLTTDADNNLPENHWARPYIRTVAESDFTVRFDGFASPINLNLAHVYHFSLSKCDGIEIKYEPTGQTVSIQDDCIYFGDSEANIEFPADLRASSVVAGDFCMQSLLLQMSSYEDEYDSMLDDLLEADTRAAELQFKAATGVDANEILSDLIGNLPESIALALVGKEFTAKLVGGRMHFELSRLAA